MKDDKKPHNFYTLTFVIDSKDIIDAENSKVIILKQLQKDKVYVFETQVLKGWRYK